MTDKPLTPKQRAFVAAYVGAAAGNATEACRLAGYAGNDKTLGEMGRENLAKPGIAAALEVFRLATAKASIMDAQEVAERLSRIGRGSGEGPEGVTEKRLVNSKDGFVEADLPPGFSHQIEAIKALAKIRGYESPTKTEVTGVVGVMSMTAEVEAALETWMLIRNDPRVIAVIEEVCG